MKTTKSEQLFNQAQQFIPGGVNSPVRAFKAVGGTPLFIQRGKGAYIYDEDDNCFIDYVHSWGPLILGHAHPEVVNAVKKAAELGLSFGAPSHLEVELAETICDLIPSIEKVRMVNSGTEATMSAIRLARAVTGRDKIVKFEGCYHGHVDSLLVKSGSGTLTFGKPSSPGIPESLTEHTLVANFNDLDSVQQLFEQHSNHVAAVIIEPVAANMNCVIPQQDFLTGLRQLCDKFGSLLIFDEVITGFRLSLAGAQGYYAIKPDLTTLGKIIGGGMPVGAFGGRDDIMEQLAPNGPVYQAGTLSGNPIAMASGLATLEQISKPNFYENLRNKTKRLVDGIQELANTASIPLTINHIESIFGLFFTDAQVVDSFTAVMACDVSRFKKFHHAMLAEGVYLAPSAFEVGFLSSAHSDTDIKRTLTAFEKAFQQL